MKIKEVFIIVPSPTDDSPVKGAAALANSLCEWLPVTFITLKSGRDDFNLLNENVKWISLADYSWRGKFKSLSRLFRQAGDQQNIASISSSFSADFINSLVNNYAITCASVRGNLPLNYSDTYGFIGRLIAYVHLKRLKKLNHVVSMTRSMAEQVERYIDRTSPVIGNFIDEGRVVKYRKNKRTNKVLRFIFTGSFTERKQPLLLIEMVAKLHKQGIDFILDMLGDGPLIGASKKLAETLGVEDLVVFHGHVNEPYEYIAEADVLILPSLSEGIPRSVLEALCLGVPCILRDVDGNRELVKSGVNGELFATDLELANTILKVVRQTQDGIFHKNNLIPDKFLQSSCSESYLSLISQ
ncbi:glycosyltransferase [Pseudomonadales bacterium]|nr:glycosyltransferase [Pseudomonadales bacterium]